VAEASPSGKWSPARRNIYSKKNRGIKITLSVIRTEYWLKKLIVMRTEYIRK
jgi:hypothetical protein